MLKVTHTSALWNLFMDTKWQWCDFSVGVEDMFVNEILLNTTLKLKTKCKIWYYVSSLKKVIINTLLVKLWYNINLMEVLQLMFNGLDLTC